ncbi:hypothetical protein GALMADRAFT_785848 [Galerina marginata CBS 339.88]|uniref:Uncharacterized protein n=1 Tax=Galerina marginata (strain CBS 339.88) TaxID=685588 RepID=A0A067SN08_GALM3|nr:hypothetical protein GALMADRAFT_785848 [Galerina marginata CBS 339.88]
MEARAIGAERLSFLQVARSWVYSSPPRLPTLPPPATSSVNHSHDHEPPRRTPARPTSAATRRQLPPRFITAIALSRLPAPSHHSCSPSFAATPPFLFLDEARLWSQHYQKHQQHRQQASSSSPLRTRYAHRVLVFGPRGAMLGGRDGDKAGAFQRR